MSTFAERKQKASPAEVTVRLCLDLRLLDRFKSVYSELERLQFNQGDDDDKSEQTTLDGPSPKQQVRSKLDEVAAVSQELVDASEPYVFRKIRRPVWRALMDKHPPTDEQVAEAEEERRVNPKVQRPDVNPETFWPDVIATASHDPKLTLDDVLWLRDGDEDWPGLPAGEFDRIISAVQGLHSTGVEIPKEWLSTAQILRLGQSGTTPAATASRSRSSGGGSRKKGSRTG